MKAGRVEERSALLISRRRCSRKKIGVIVIPKGLAVNGMAMVVKALDLWLLSLESFT